VFVVSLLFSKKNHISQFSHQMFNVSALLLDDASKPPTLYTDQWRDQPNAATVCPTQRQRLSVAGFNLVDCRESSTLIGHLLKSIPNSIID